MSLTKVTSIKVKVLKDDGTEIRRLRFSRETSSECGFLDRIEVRDHYKSLMSFLMSSLSELYPDLPVGSFNEHVIFSVKDEDDDIVSFSSEDEYLVAIGNIMNMPPHSDVPYGPIEQVEDSMRFEVNVLKSKSAISTTRATWANGASRSQVLAEGKSVASLSEVSVVESAPSDIGNPEFVINMSDSVTSSTSAPKDPTVDAASAAAAAAAAAVAAAAAAATAAFPPPSPASTGAHGGVNLAGSVPTACMAPPGSPQAFGDPSGPARAFLAQFLPGLAEMFLAEVFARSMYATQWAALQAMPNPPMAAPSASAAPARQTPPSGQPTSQLNPMAAGLTAATAAAATAVNAAAALRSAADAASQASVPVENSTKGEPQSPPAPEAETRPMPPSQRASPTGPRPESSELPVVHTGITCDGCDMSPIVGIRYKCAVRHDFDLCEACEAGASTDSPFPFLKIRTPAHSPAALICLLRPDQPGSIEEALAAARFSRGRNSPCPRVHPAAQGRRAPQRGGWGEGRRNFPRWMREAARRQATAAAAAGIPGDVPARCGPRIQRNRQDEEAPAQKSQDGAEKPQEETPITKNERDPPTRPASVASSVSGDEPPVTANGTAASSETMKQETPSTPAALVDETPKADVKQPPLEVAPSALSTSPAAAGNAQPTESLDMLAVSMRSLASSMTTSLPMGSGSRDKSRASNPGEGKLQVKPMARFVTDVSVADGSPLPPNTRFVKTWCMRNDGAITFPPGCRLMPSGGDLMEGPEEGVPVEQRSPGEEFHVSVSLTTPPKSGRYIGYWRLRTSEGQNFGHRIWADVLVTGGTADLIDEASLDGDWDLVNMQRLSKAVEDTAKDVGNAVADAAVVAAAASADEKAVPETAASPVDAEESNEPADKSGEPIIDAADIPPADPTVLPAVDEALAGHEEMKSSDAEDVSREEASNAHSGNSMVSAEVASQVEIQPEAQPQPQPQPQPLTAKWHRELCSLAEMGFEDTGRNIRLLEKHLSHSGAPGMERVLHELLSWTEISFQ